MGLSVPVRVFGDPLEELDHPPILLVDSSLGSPRRLHPAPAEKCDGDGCEDEDDRDEDRHGSGGLYLTAP
jgi:hypothetical protein